MKATQTKKPQLYIVRFYEEYLFHDKVKKTYSGNLETYYYSHSGCTKLLWEMQFSSKEKLKEQLKKWYPDKKFLSFYCHINDLFKNENYQHYKQYHLIISNPFEPKKSFRFNFKKPKKKGQRKRKNFVYDDMWNSDAQYTKRLIKERDFKTYHSY